MQIKNRNWLLLNMSQGIYEKECFKFFFIILTNYFNQYGSWKPVTEEFRNIII